MRPFSISILFTLIYAFNAFGWSGLDVDTAVVQGTLSNGLHYYIYPTDQTDERIAMKLVVKAGSLHERDDQRGLAHFVEHMVFQGSADFADGSLLHHLDNIGAPIGRHSNAYTTFDHTYFSLSLENTPAMLAEGCQILSNIAGQASFPEYLVQREKGVILTEHDVTTKNLGWRVSRQLLGEFLGKIRHIDRNPIGTEESIQTASQQRLQEYYEKWYQPDRMAVIIVGDLDPYFVKHTIEKEFGAFKTTNRGLPEPYNQDTLESGQNYYSIVDPEFPGVVQDFIRFETYPFSTIVTPMGVKYDLVQRMGAFLAQCRLDKLAQQENPPFVMAQFFSSIPFIWQYNTYVQVSGLGVHSFADKISEGLDSVMHELLQLKREGCTPRELEKAKEYAKRSLKCDKSHEAIANVCVQHFLYAAPLLDGDEYITVAHEMLEAISQKDLRIWFQNAFNLSDLHLVHTTSQEIVGEYEDWKSPFIQLDVTDTELLEDAECATTEPNCLLIDPIGKEGMIVSDIKEGDEGYETLILENGMKVILHPTYDDSGKVSCKTFAKGGRSLFPLEDHGTLAALDQLTSRVGLGELSSDDLQKWLETHGMDFDLYISDDERGIDISGKTNQAESYCELLRALFVQPPAKQLVERWIHVYPRLLELVYHGDRSPGEQFQKAIQKLLTNNNPFFQPPEIEPTDLESVSRCYRDLLNDPENFTCIVVGDFNPLEMRASVKKYLANLPSYKRSIYGNLPHMGIASPGSGGSHVLRCGKERPVTNVHLLPYTYNYLKYRCSFLPMKLFEELLSKRLFQRLRLEEGEIYSVEVSSEILCRPHLNSCVLRIEYATSNANYEYLQRLCVDELQKIASEGFTEQEVDRIVKAYDTSRTPSRYSILYSHYWLNLLGVSRKLDTVGDIHRYITGYTLSSLAKDILENQDKLFFHITLLPEEERQD